MNNCIAHQEYTLGGKIILVEREDSQLIFVNKGSFIPETIENVLKSDAPESVYRNKFLALAMVDLGMIDAIGSGIERMFTTQRERFFPLPEYSFENNSVKVTIEGKILDINYATKLASMPDLSLFDIILLDKVQKGKDLTVSEAKQLKKKKLIEGRRPNLHISFNVAQYTNQKDEYIKMKGFDESYYEDLVIKYLQKFDSASRANFRELLLDKLPSILTNKQKEDKIKNILQKMKKEKRIILSDKRRWTLDKL